MLLRNTRPDITCLTRRDFISRAMATGLIGAGFGTLDFISHARAQGASLIDVLLDEWVNDLHEIVQQSSQSSVQTSHYILPVRERNISRLLYESGGTKNKWDVYLGMTPFVDMSNLINADVIEPWDNYIPREIIDDIIPAIRDECSVDGKLYSWPFLLDVNGMGWNARITNEAELPARPPTNWSDYLERASAIVASNSTYSGATFDPHGWRSLAPFAHSVTADTYTDQGLFDFTGSAAIEALTLMKQIHDLSHSDVLQPGASALGIIGTPDEVAFATQRVGLYTKYLNAPLRMARFWDDPKNLGLGLMPKFSEVDGSTLFWTTGAALIKNGQNKESAAEYMRDLTYNPEIWRQSLAGTAKGYPGQLPPYKSMYANWQKQPPEWLPDFVLPVHRELEHASSIRNHPLALEQFVIGQPIWEKYLTGAVDNPKLVLKEVADAVAASR